VVAKQPLNQRRCGRADTSRLPAALLEKTYVDLFSTFSDKHAIEQEVLATSAPSKLWFVARSVQIWPQTRHSTPSSPSQ